MKFSSLLSIFILIFSLSTCSKSKPAKPTGKTNELNGRIILTIKDQKIKVEVADTPEERALGLMFRQELDENTGMLFIFEQEGIYPFWMKFTQIPLSIAYIDNDNIIIDIIEMVPNQEEIRYSPSVPFIYALEMNQGWFAKNDINIGDTIYGIP